MISEHRSGAWLLLAAAVVVGGALQAATAVPGLGRGPIGWFAAAAVASLLVLITQIVIAAWACAAIVARAGPTRPDRRLLLWSAIAAIVMLAVSVIAPPALPVAVIAALCVLPTAATGQTGAVTGFRVFGRTPVRAILASAAVIVVCAVSWVVALVTGFFLTGIVGGFAMWLWFGVTGAGLLLWWTDIHRRAGSMTR